MPINLKKISSIKMGLPEWIVIACALALTCWLCEPMVYRYFVPPPPPPAAPDPNAGRGCLDSKKATLISVDSEHEGFGNKGDWHWHTLAVFQMENKEFVTCTFYDMNLASVWKPGMIMHTNAGARSVGSYD